MQESPLEVAKLLYKLLKEVKPEVTLMDIHVGLYIYHGFGLAKNKVSSFNEQPEAWPCGIVFPSVANKFDITKVEDKQPKLQNYQKCEACCLYVIKMYLKNNVNLVVPMMTESRDNPWLKSLSSSNALRSKVYDSVVCDWFLKNIR